MNENLDPSSENLSSNEREFENNLRPVSFEDFSGQDHVINNLKIFVEKPYTLNNSECLEIQNLLNNDTKIMIGHTYLYNSKIKVFHFKSTSNLFSKSLYGSGCICFTPQLILFVSGSIFIILTFIDCPIDKRSEGLLTLE